MQVRKLQWEILAPGIDEMVCLGKGVFGTLVISFRLDCMLKGVSIREKIFEYLYLMKYKFF